MPYPLNRIESFPVFRTNAFGLYVLFNLPGQSQRSLTLLTRPDVFFRSGGDGEEGILIHTYTGLPLHSWIWD